MIDLVHYRKPEKGGKEALIFFHVIYRKRKCMKKQVKTTSKTRTHISADLKFKALYN